MQKIRLGLAGLVAGVWLAGYVLAYKSHTSPPSELSGLMVVVLGWAFGGEVLDARKRGKEEVDDESDT